MNLKLYWQKYIGWLLCFWIGWGLIFKLHWLILVIGLFGWVLLLWATAPGIFWSYLALFAVYSPKNELFLKKALTYKPLVVGPYVRQGLNMAKQKNWPATIALFEQAAQLPQTKLKPQLRIFLAVAYQRAEDYKRSAQLLEELVGQGTVTMETYFNLAVSYFMQGDLPTALSAAQKARALNLQATGPVLILGRIHFTQQDFQAAKNDYEWAIQHIKWPVESLYWLGRAELELNETNAAVSHLKLAVERITEDPVMADISVTEAQGWLDQALKRQTD